MPKLLRRPLHGRWMPYRATGETILPPRRALSASFLGGLAPSMGVGGRHPQGTLAPAIVAVNTRYRLQALQTTTGVRIVLPNYGSHEEQIPDYTVTFTACVEKYGNFASGGNLASSGSDANETFYRVTFGGKNSVEVSPRGKVLSDPVPGLTVPQGGFVYVRLYATIPAAAPEVGIPSGKEINTAAGEIVESQGSTVDKTGGGQLVNTGGGVFGPAPVVMVGTLAAGVTETRRVGLIGDSIGYGTNATARISFLERALIAANVPYYHLCQGGSQAARITDTEKGMNRRDLLWEATSIVSEMGANDVGQNALGATAYAAMQATYLAYWKMLATVGKTSGTRPVWQTTVLPRMTSSAAGATPTAGSADRCTWNDWLRAGAPTAADGVTPVTPGTSGAVPYPYLTGVFETADTIEANSAGTLTRNGTYWKDWTTSSYDGLHPAEPGSVTIAAAINVGALT